MVNRLLRQALQFAERRANKWGYRSSWAPPSFQKPDAELHFDLEFIIAHFMLFKPSVFFIQIGANDGVSNDPLNKFVERFDWKGILLEPLPDVFEMLKRTYAHKPHLRLLNAAIADKDGSQLIYTVHIEPGVFSKAHQFSSFLKESLLKQTQYVPDVAKRIEERIVRCVSFDTLLKEAEGNEIDLLQIDAEGYDYAIIKMIDFSRLKPSIIAYEHPFMSKAQQDEIAELLLSHDYRMTRGNLDTIGYRPPVTFGFH